jgi:alkylation response protein AidB-like acyl-CoA dehydrogenase
VSPVDTDLTAEQRLIVGTVRDFVERELYPHEDSVERLDEVPQDLASQIRATAIAAGLYAANMPAELGGGGLDATARELAGAICAAAPLSVAAVLEILRATEGADVGTGYAIQRGGSLPAYRAMLDSADAAEGARAFAERRPPVWQGR